MMREVARKSFIASRDLFNIARYGLASPRYAERIWIAPGQVENVVELPKVPKLFRRWISRREWASGLVVGHWPTHTDSLINTVQVRSSEMRWIHGVPWDQTPDFRDMADGVLQGYRWAGCSTIDDVRRRFRELDVVYSCAATEQRMKTRRELGLATLREEGGVMIGIGPQGRLHLMKGCGYHRLAIARILALHAIPAQVGLVHESALGVLSTLREKR